jgi:hypothetical protein
MIHAWSSPFICRASHPSLLSIELLCIVEGNPKFISSFKKYFSVYYVFAKHISDSNKNSLP